MKQTILTSSSLGSVLDDATIVPLFHMKVPANAFLIMEVSYTHTAEAFRSALQTQTKVLKVSKPSKLRALFYPLKYNFNQNTCF